MKFVLRSKKKNPPQGWTFYQPQTNWRNPLPMATTFWKTVDNIVAMRLNNPRHGLETNPDKVAVEYEQYVVKRLKNDPQWCIQDMTDLTESEQIEEVKKKPLPEPPGKDTLSLPRRPVPEAAGGARLADAISSTHASYRTLRDWLGAGGMPVPPYQSEARAAVCVQCPKNGRGNWFARVSSRVASAILDQRRAKTTLAITVPQESELGTCDVCLCHLPLKVHVPLSHIIANTSPAVWAELPAACWIKQEFSQNEP